ncbi:hypothetical protein GCM10010381_60730 [Streptomyces xantholiticus]|nr:hypothetical protein GCM10010381_60730 [Streptomyces xantholiticus]
MALLRWRQASDAWLVPGQRKRKRQRQDAGQQAALRTGPGAGRWQVIFETHDESKWHAHLRRLRAGTEQTDWAMTRIDTLCGRLTHPTTYRLSLFIPDLSRDPGRDNSDH